MGTIGGSSTENGKNAALELMRSLQKGEAIAIIPDGPKGPSMTLSRSAVYFAQNRETDYRCHIQYCRLQNRRKELGQDDAPQTFLPRLLLCHRGFLYSRRRRRNQA